jgi:hypothetical protein
MGGTASVARRVEDFSSFVHFRVVGNRVFILISGGALDLTFQRAMFQQGL